MIWLLLTSSALNLYLARLAWIFYRDLHDARQANEHLSLLITALKDGRDGSH